MSTPPQRQVNITQALAYPFCKRNILGTLLAPNFFVAVLAGIGVGIVTGLRAEAVVWFVVPLLALSLIAMAIGLGWQTIDALYTAGYDAPAPAWTLENCGRFILNGAKVIAAAGVLVAPVVLLSCVPDFIVDEHAARTKSIEVNNVLIWHSASARNHKGALLDELDLLQMEPDPAAIPADITEARESALYSRMALLALSVLTVPLLAAATARSANTQKWADLFDFYSAFQLARRRYAKALAVSVMICCGMVMLVFAVATPIGMLVGSLLVSLMLVSAHLIAQVFDGCSEETMKPQDPDSSLTSLTFPNERRW